MSRKFIVRVLASLLIVGLLVGLLPLSALAAPPGPGPAPAPGPAGYHVVQPGENLYRISLRYGTTVWAIAQANGIRDVNRIRAYQVLLIPGPGQHVPGGHHPTVYIVQAGDTLSAIAWRFGTTAWAIAQANGIWNQNLIYIGQRLRIP
jgi:LysM repeat protein